MKFRLRVLVFYTTFVTTCLILQALHFMMIQQHSDKWYKDNFESNYSEILRPDAEQENSQRTILYLETNEFNISTEVEQEHIKKRKIIFLYNLPGFLVNTPPTNKLYKNCDYKNCVYTRDKNKLLKAHAVIFYVGIRYERMGVSPPIQPTLRNPDQVWIFTATEPPEHYYNTDYLLPSWHNTMNWSSFYRLDSDIPISYGALIRQNPDKTRQDYVSLYESKTRNAVWYVSHCQVASERRLYVNEMIKNGFDVDILGGCGSEGKRTKTNYTEFAQTVPNYKFYLAFENSFCNDYVTEKFFRSYNSDMIIIARGGADYNRLFPPGTFVNTANFQDVSSLVKYLLHLGSDREKYIEMLRKKDSYYSVKKPLNRNCEICKRLNNLSSFRKTYGAIGDYLNADQCRRPNDL
ncbi:alpha-(1,3)-fucosyltransferase C-like [Mercenaria mercenaria]|uniref:alpha-(1,3)-fucosyltransferase C-like n=1 Tax=Mercenaria mercenaria TaxID=6596 RepID=UPI00234F3F0B|nr:alpha-(1,3)-fucosyltransferase C-like [Mercenaria mercenaria]